MKKNSAFSGRLQSALSLRQMKAADLSRMSGIDKGTISRYLHGEGLTLKNAVHIADVLNVSMDYLTGRTDETN